MNEPTLDFQTLHEIIRAGQRNLSQKIWDYLVGGTETETSVKRNRQALDSIAFRPRYLRDVREVDCSAELFGRKLRLPVILAPIGSLESLGEGGGATAAKAAAEFGVCHMLSSASQPGLEEVAEAADNMRIYQLYVRGDDAFVDDHAERAIAAGYDAFCITVDVPHYSRRERDIAKRFIKYWRREQEEPFQFQAGLDWKDIERFKAKHPIKLIIKGIMTAEDAKMCVDLGCEGIYVSNHGGRQLDHCLGTASVLPEIVEAVGGKATIVFDGGINRGTDVVKAMALGADVVGLGRMLGYGMAAAGQYGVVRMLELLEDEVTKCLGMLGATSFAELEPSHITPGDAGHRSPRHQRLPAPRPRRGDLLATVRRQPPHQVFALWPLPVGGGEGV